jgi:oxalyl-CoA decarboxylase
MAEVLITPQTATAAETAKRETPETTDGFHLVIDALKLNGLNTAPRVSAICMAWPAC